MPHTSRNKRPVKHQKRQQVTSDDGWTHVTNSGNARRVIRATVHAHEAQGSLSQHQSVDKDQEIRDSEPTLGPAEAPAQLTLSELESQYEAYREQWIHSDSWHSLRTDLNTRVLGTQDAAQADEGLYKSESKYTKEAPVDAIVCIGLGSLSGFLRGGWTDRRSVSMYQLAALQSINDHILDAGSPKFPVYVQDPVFNSLDRGLLESRGMTVVDHPEAFSLITKNTLLFCPGAERKHLELVLPSNPRYVLGGPLEATASEVIQSFADRVESRSLVPFQRHEHAFWRTRLYYRADTEV